MCVAIYVPAVEVAVLDSVTGARREKDTDLLIYSLDQGGARIDSVRGQRDSVPIAGGNVGRLRLIVKRADYEPWSQFVLVRAQGYCQTPVKERVLARLQPTE